VTREELIDEIIRKIGKRKWAIYSKSKKKGKGKSRRRKRLGTFNSLKAAKKRERQIQYFKNMGENMKLTRRQLRLLIEAEAQAALTNDAIEQVILDTLETEGGAAGAAPLDAALDQKSKEQNAKLPSDFDLDKYIDGMQNVKKHKAGDYIEMSGLNEVRRLVREELKKIVFYDKYSLGIDDVPEKTKGHEDIIGHT
jgi:hypothetical protein